jgi:two-component sensor histidine kinase
MSRTAPPEGLKRIGMVVPMVPNTQAVMQSGRVHVSVDAKNDVGCSRHMNELMGAGSVAYVPLPARDGRPIGVLVALRRQAGEFAPEQLEMARLFAARAGAAIESARLYEQTRHDAQTRAMLLQELNHRVKNSLSGIVSLLSIGEPDMPPDARQWLSRVIERIRTMARTHELFVAGAKTTRLRELVQQTLPSLEVIKPPGVAIRTELDADAVDVSLGPERAVGLAMAMYEVCCNAIVHGLGGHGTVLIRAHVADGVRIVVEVMDDGTGSARAEGGDAGGAAGMRSASGNDNGIAGANGKGNGNANGNGNGNGKGRVHAEMNGSGFGLDLVRGLVSRELQGSFTMTKRPDGGMTASIEFPVAAHREVEAMLV